MGKTLAELETVPDLFGWRLAPPPIRRSPLSPRERQILDLTVLSGLTHKETAFELGLSDATVRVLYSRAMRKLGRCKYPRRA